MTTNIQLKGVPEVLAIHFDMHETLKFVIVMVSVHVQM